MKSPTPEGQCAKGIFQMLYPICVVNFTNNISRCGYQAEHETTFQNTYKLTSGMNTSTILLTGQGFILENNIS